MLFIISLWPLGYGFVDFEDPSDAARAVAKLQANGILAQFAKVKVTLNAITINCSVNLLVGSVHKHNLMS